MGWVGMVDKNKSTSSASILIGTQRWFKKDISFWLQRLVLSSASKTACIANHHLRSLHRNQVFRILYFVFYTGFRFSPLIHKCINYLRREAFIRGEGIPYSFD